MLFKLIKPKVKFHLVFYSLKLRNLYIRTSVLNDDIIQDCEACMYTDSGKLITFFPSISSFTVIVYNCQGKSTRILAPTLAPQLINHVGIMPFGLS